MESWFFRRYSYEQKIYINLYIFLVLTEINCHGDLPLSISWNWDGSRFATTCKDKSLRVIDPRTGNVVAEKKKAHEGNKTSKCIFLKSGKIFTLGFSKRCDRQYGLWDPVCISYYEASNFEIWLTKNTVSRWRKNEIKIFRTKLKIPWLMKK